MHTHSSLLERFSPCRFEIRFIVLPPPFRENPLLFVVVGGDEEDRVILNHGAASG